MSPHTSISVRQYQERLWARAPESAHLYSNPAPAAFELGGFGQVA